jgi:pentatricopeptide repeat protein
MLRSCSQIATSSKILLVPAHSTTAKSVRAVGRQLQRHLTTTSSHATGNDEDRRNQAAWSSLVDTVSKVNSSANVSKASHAKQTEVLLTDYLAGGGKAPRVRVRVPLYKALRGVGNGEGQPDQNGTTILKPTLKSSDIIDDRIRKDAQSMKLIKEVARHADRGDVERTVRTCVDLKKRLNQLRVAFEYEDALLPPHSVYLKLLTALSRAGMYPACEEVLDDMRSSSIAVGAQELDLLLYAAVVHGNMDIIDDVLGRIASNSVDTSFETTGDIEEEKDAAGASTNILSEKTTTGWTANTFETMLIHCEMTHNLEYALALLAAASQRSARQRHGTSLSGRQSFIGEVLQPRTCVAMITLMRECRQARLAADFALWTEEQITLRKHDLRTWINVLQCCAHEDWWPGVEVAWKKAVTVGLLAVDEGLLLSILRCASRARKVDFIKGALESFQRSAPSSITLQEWHLSPLLEAQCAAHEFDGAIRTATRIARTTTGSSVSDRLIALVKAAGSSTVDLRAAYHAFVNVGTDVGEQGGVTNEVLIALIRAANALRSHTTALSLYAVRHYVRNETSNGNAQILPTPIELKDLTINSPADGDASMSIEAALDRLIASEQKYRLEVGSTVVNGVRGSKPANQDSLVPTISTYNALLSTAIDTESSALGRFVFDQINKERCPADETTYERAIVLSLTQSSYEDAFRLLNECKMRNLRPTRAAYQALGLRCLKEEDDRWISIGREMIDLGYYPGQDLHEELVRGDWVDSHKLRPFDVGYRNTARSRPSSRNSR